MQNVVYEEHFPAFITIICYEWLHLIESLEAKAIITESLRYLTEQGKIAIHAFVIMDNHFHLIWRIRKGYRRPDVQRDFLHHTAKEILKHLKTHQPAVIEKIEVNLRDRKYQVWQRNSLSVELRTAKVYEQKLNYIHDNPVKAGVCTTAEDYRYSSARYYIKNERNWDFLIQGDD